MLCHDIKPWLRNVPSCILTDAATVTMYKGIKLVVEITVTPSFKALDASRVIWECHRVNKEPRPMKSKYSVACPTVPHGPAQQSQLQEWVVAAMPSPSCWSQSWLKPWDAYIYAARQALLSAWFLSFSSSNAAIGTTPVNIQWVSTGHDAGVSAVGKPGSPSAILKELWGIPWLYHPLLYTGKGFECISTCVQVSKRVASLPSASHLQKWLAASGAVQWNW